MNLASLNRQQQLQRKRNVYASYKQLLAVSTDEKRTKESIYKEIADKHGYVNLNSIKSIVSELKHEELENNKVKLDYAKGVLDTVIEISESITNQINQKELDFRYDLKISDDGGRIFVNGTYNSNYTTDELQQRFYKRAVTFDHFSITDLKTAVGRISSFLEECYLEFWNNTKQK